MTDDRLSLAIEPRAHITDESRRELDQARRKVLSGQADDEEIIRLNVLERSWVDEQRSTEKRKERLSTRLEKLWGERGDFSKFRASDLDSKGLKAEIQKTTDDDDDLGANLEGLVDEVVDGSAKGEVEEGSEEEDAAADREDVMTIEEMRQLRTDMLQRLGMAQNSVYFSHALVSLLINSTKAADGAEGSGAGRAGSVASVSAANPHAARAAATASASGFQRSMAGVAPSMGSASTLEAELGIEPYVLGASRLEGQIRQFEKRNEEDYERDTKGLALAAADADEEEEGGEDEENADVESAKVARSDAQLLDNEVSDHAHAVVERYEGKLQGLRSAVEILRKGARMLRPDDEVAKHEKQRWQTLSQARQAGWGITPGKPARGAAAGKRELLQDLSGRRTEEPARDAWIGYGVPESHPSYRRRALAYVPHTSSQQTDGSDQALLFVARSIKRVRVEIRVGTESWISEDVGSVNGGERGSMDALLRLAQDEVVDAELFDTVVAESRALLSAGMVPVTIEDEDTVSLQINSTTKLKVCRTDKENANEDAGHKSPLMTCVLSFLRLSLISRYRERAGLGSRSTVGRSDVPSTAEPVTAPLLQPLLGLIHYASFVAHLHRLLSSLTEEDKEKQIKFEMSAFDKIGDAYEWQRSLLQTSGRDAAMLAVKKLGGTASILRADQTIAHLVLSYPSQISLNLPSKAASKGGVQLKSIDLPSLRSILRKELI